MARLRRLTAAFLLASSCAAASDPRANPASVVVAGNGSARFTVLTSRLIRLEWSAGGVFEDRETLAILVSLCENGVNPEALAAVVRDIRREAAAVVSLRGRASIRMLVSPAHKAPECSYRTASLLPCFPINTITVLDQATSTSAS